MGTDLVLFSTSVCVFLQSLLINWFFLFNAGEPPTPDGLIILSRIQSYRIGFQKLCYSTSCTRMERVFFRDMSFFGSLVTLKKNRKSGTLERIVHSTCVYDRKLLIHTLQFCMQSPSFLGSSLSLSAILDIKPIQGNSILHRHGCWEEWKKIKLEFDQITTFQRCNKLCVAPTVKNAITFVISYFDAVIFFLSEIPLLL